MWAEPEQEPSAQWLRQLDAIAARHAPELRGRMVASADASHDHIALSRLAERSCFDEALAVFRRRYPAGDRRALASMFIQWYAATCWPALVVAAVMLDSVPAPASTALQLDDYGTPMGLIVRGGIEAAGVSAALERLVSGHAAVLVDNAAAAGRLSPRVPWGNVSNVLGWTLEQLAGLAPEHRIEEARGFFERRWLEDGSSNPLWVGDPPDWRRDGRPPRKTCCLRYRLHGVPYCGDCPVPAQRRRTGSH